MQNYTSNSYFTQPWNYRRRKIRTNISLPALMNGKIPPHFWCQLMVSLEVKPKYFSRNSPDAQKQSGNSHPTRHTTMSTLTCVLPLPVPLDDASVALVYHPIWPAVPLPLLIWNRNQPTSKHLILNTLIMTQFTKIHIQSTLSMTKNLKSTTALLPATHSFIYI